MNESIGKRIGIKGDSLLAIKIVTAVIGLNLVFVLGISMAFADLGTQTIKGHKSGTVYQVKTFDITKKSNLTGDDTQLVYEGYFFETLKVTDLIPKGVKANELSEFVLKNALVIQLTDKTNRKYSAVIRKTDIPASILNQLPGWKDIKVSKGGAGFAGFLEFEDEQQIARMLGRIGIKLDDSYIVGAMQDNAVKIIEKGKLSKKTQPNAFVKSFSFNIEIEAPKIPTLDRFFKFDNIAFGVNTGLYENSPWKDLPANLKKTHDAASLNLFFQAGSTVSLFGEKRQMDALIDFGKKEITPPVVKTDAGTPDQQELTLLTVTDDGLRFDGFKIEGFGGYAIQLTEKSQDGKTQEFKIDLAAFGGIKKYGKQFDFTADFIIDAKQPDSKKMVTLNYLQLDSTLTLGQILGERLGTKLQLSDPIKSLALNEVRLQPDAMEARVTLFEEEVDFYLVESGTGSDKGTTLAFNLENKFTLDRLLPTDQRSTSLGKNLNKITVPRTLFFISENGIKTNRKDISNPVLRDVYDRVFNDGPSDTGKKTDAILNMNGVGFISLFDTAQFSGKYGSKIKSGAKKFGNQANPVLSADLAGIFDSRPLTINLFVSIPINPSIIPQKIKKVLYFPEGIEPRVQIGLMKDELAVGVGAMLDLKGNLPKAASGMIQVDMDDDGLGLEFVGELGDWEHPFGASSVTLNDFMFEAAIDDEASFTPGFNASMTYLGNKVDVGGSVHLQLSDPPLPKGVSFKGSIDDLDSQSWVYVDNAIVILLIVGGALGLVVGGGVLIAGVCTGGVALIIIAALTIAGSSAVLGIFSNIVGPTLTVAAIADVVGENIAHPERIEKAFKDLEKLKMGDAGKQLAEAVIFPVKKDFKIAEKGLGILEAKIITMKNGHVNFATPGSADIANGIPEGFSVSGDAYLFDTIHLGHQSHTTAADSGGEDTDTQLTATAPGLKDSASDKGNKANDFTLGPLTFVENRLYTRPNPLGITSRVKLFGEVEEDVTISINKGVYFNTDTRFKDVGDVRFSFEYNRENKDFMVTADLTSSIAPYLNNEIKIGIDEIISNAHLSAATIDKDYNKAVQDVQEAVAKKKALLQKKTDFIENDPRVKRLEDQLNKAENYAQSGVVAYIDNKCNHLKESLCCGKYCPGICTHPRAACKSAWHYLIGRAEDAEKDAKAALDTAKNAVAVAKSLLDDIQKAGNELDRKLEIKSQISALKKNTSGVKPFLDQLKRDIDAKLAGEIITVKGASLIGKMSDVKNTKPLILELKYTLNGKDRTDYFGFKPGDIKYNARALALLPIRVLDELKNTQEAEYLTHWFFAEIDRDLKDITDSMEKELASDEDQYRNVLNSMESVKSSLLASTLSFRKDHGDTLSTYTKTDMMPPSKTLTRRYLAVGHSSLCLGVAPNGVDVYQENCKDVQAEQWTTKSIGNDYVQLKTKGLCLKAKTADAGNGQPLVLSQCNNKDDHEQWKILSSDGFYDKIVNRFSQKCLHFDTENANPRTAYATWTSCLDMDSQTFRDIKDAERPTYHGVKEEIQAKTKVCLASKKGFEAYFKKSKSGHFTATKTVYETMKQKGDDVLISTPCKAGADDRFNYIEQVNGEIKIVHVQSGWCLAPQSRNSANLILKPCNKNTNMFWQNLRQGARFEIRNTYLKNKCITLNPASQGEESGTAQITKCLKSDSQEIKFTK